MRGASQTPHPGLVPQGEGENRAGVRRPLRGVARAATRLVLGLLGFAIGLVLISLIAGAALLWRLNQGPLDVTGIAQRVEAKFAPDIVSGRIVLAMEKTAGVHLLRLDVTDVGRLAEGGRKPESVQSATLVAPLRRLLKLNFVPTEVVANGVRLEVTRTARSASSGTTNLREAEALQRVRITDLQVTVDDAVLATTWRVTGAAVELARQGDAVAGQADATLAVGDVSAQVHVTAQLNDRGAHAEATSTPVSPADVARAVPRLAALAAFDAPLSLHAIGDFGPALQTLNASLHAEAGAGTVLLPAKGPPSPAHFAAMSLDAQGTPTDINLQALHIVLASPSGNPPSNLVIGGTAKIVAGQVRAQTTLDVDHAALADLGGLWPERVGGGSRPWLVQNLTNGIAHDGHFTFGLSGNLSGDDIALTSAAGSMPAEDVTIWWLRPVPPLEHGHAVLSLVDADTMLITGSGARTGNLVMKTGTMRITGLSVRDQVSVLNGDLAGPLADVFTLLANPRLGLLSKRPVPITNPSGSAVAHLTVNLPLEDRVTIDQVGIHVTSKLTDVHLGGVVAGRNLDHGQIGLDVTNDGLKATGTALLDQLPAKLGLDMDFRDGPPSQVLEHASAAVSVTPQAAQAAGLGVIGLQSGVLGTTVDYAARRDTSAVLAVAADLTNAAIVTPIGWSKAAGAAGQATGQALLDHGNLVGLQGVKASAPGLDISASGEMAGGRVTVVHIQTGQVGRSSATGTIGLPQRDGEPYRITLAGSRLDLEGQLASKGASKSPSNNGVPYVLDVRFDQVLFGPNKAIGPLSLQATGTGRRLTSGHLASCGREQVKADLVMAGSERRVHAVAGDLGLLLLETDTAHELNGGALTLTGVFDDSQPGSPFAGTMELNDFSVRCAPVTGKVLQALTVYGLGDALRGPGLAFDRMVAPFRLDGGVLQVNEARAFSASLGVTAAGSLDFDRNTVDLTGTIVPAYAVNSLPGRVPFVGKLFSPEKGSGMFAAYYGLRGAINDPSISINPLAALTPGFMRSLFDVFR